MKPSTSSSSNDSAELLRKSINDSILNDIDQMVELRRDLHANPELAGEEHRTSELLSSRLADMGLELRPLPDTGVVADLHVGAPDDSWIAIRADIDCVPIADLKEVAWRSTRDGCCHACGHDAHATMALFAARSMAAQRKSIQEYGASHNVRFVFQPAEETATGACELIDAGVLEGVNGMIALHCDPFLDVGQIGLRHGPITSNTCTFRITITGEGGHSARPHQAIDPIPAAVNLVSLLYQLAPRSMDSRYPMCLSITSVTAGEAFNAIPGEAVICGNLRTERMQDQLQIKDAIDSCIRGITEATGCTAHIEYPYNAPATDNHLFTNTLLKESAVEVVGSDGIIDIDLASMGGEDFAYYQQHVPGSMARLGTGNGPADKRKPLHSPQFDIDESALPVGARLLAGAAMNCLFPTHRSEDQSHS